MQLQYNVIIQAEINLNWASIGSNDGFKLQWKRDYIWPNQLNRRDSFPINEPYIVCQALVHL